MALAFNLLRSFWASWPCNRGLEHQQLNISSTSGTWRTGMKVHGRRCIFALIEHQSQRTVSVKIFEEYSNLSQKNASF